VNIKSIYADREFFAVDVFQAIEETGSKYVIPAREKSEYGGKSNEKIGKYG